MEQRSLLYVAGHTGETVIPTPLLANSGWKVCTACDAEETIALLRSERLDVGLAELPPCSRDFGRSWVQIHNARPHMKWIALVPVCSVQDQHLREAISTFFYDYHTVPVDLDRLFGTLGHAYGMVAIVRRHHAAAELTVARTGSLARAPRCVECNAPSTSSPVSRRRS
jgi:DNA-binding NtrC family response regulator